MPSINIYLPDDDYQIISDKAKPRKVSPSTVGAEWLKERCNIERGKAQE